MAKALWVNSEKQTIEIVECAGLDDMRKYVGGSICVAQAFATGDVLYVDDEGLLKRQEHFFMVEGQPQPLAGNGIVVGPEVETATSWYNADVRVTVELLQRLITFKTREQAASWGKANASEPAQVIYTVTGGRVKAVVLGRYGELFRRATEDDKEAKEE